MYELVIRKILPSGEIEGVDLVDPFVKICNFLKAHPESLSWRGKATPNLSDCEDVLKIAHKFVNGYQKSDLPARPGTVPDEMVSIVMQSAYGYSELDTKRIKKEHQHSMCAENCVGALLERYLDSVLRYHGWVWCCGDFVKAVDFIYPRIRGWDALQIKNRDNSENSSSSAIRYNTTIRKWFRTFSRNGATNWDNLPQQMRGKGLSEEGFIKFVRAYLAKEKRKLTES